MKNKLLKNIKINLYITLATGILNFLSNKYFIKYMGPETLGLMRLFTQMITYLSLVEMGMGTASTYALYKPLIEKDIKKINIVTSTIAYFYKKISFGIFCIGIVLSFSLPFFIKNDNYGNQIYIYWLLYVINTSIGYTFAKYSILFIANQEYDFVRKIQGIGKIIFQCLQIVVIIKVQSFILFIIIMMFENLYNYYFYSKHYKNYYNYIEKVPKKDKGIMTDMKNLFWHKLAGLIVHNTDYIVLSKFVSLTVVGIYSSYLMISRIILTLINIITPVLTPKIGLFVAKNNKEKVYEYWRELYGIYFFIATIFIVCTYNLIFPFIKLWLGEEFLLSKVTVICILINLYIELIRGITDSFKESCGFFDDIYSPILEGVINLVFSLILVQKFELNGVIIGTITSNIIIIALLKPILVFKRCFGKTGIDYLKSSAKLLFLSGTSIFLIQIVVNRYLIIRLSNICNWISFIQNAFILGIVSFFIVIAVFILDNKFRKIIKNKV